MAGAYKTPGVYIVEKNAFPNSVVEVATAVPAFIGYTEKADNKGKSLAGKPWRITSMAEYINYFGGPPPAVGAHHAKRDAEQVRAQRARLVQRLPVAVEHDEHLLREILLRSRRPRSVLRSLMPRPAGRPPSRGSSRQYGGTPC